MIIIKIKLPLGNEMIVVSVRELLRMKIPGSVKKTVWLLLAVFLLMNSVAFMHAYTFTHFSTDKEKRTKDPLDLSLTEKIAIVFKGIDNPKPTIKSYPKRDYKKIVIGNSIFCWKQVTPNAKGTVIMFHGYAGEKSSLLERSEELLKLGYNTFLVDFNGSGESEGDDTSIGFHEAAQVKTCYDLLLSDGERNVYLFGTSMGAAAILKAIDDYKLDPKGIILECPFGSLYKTVCARFKLMNLPSFPMAGVLTFWGGIQHGYWAFSHNPSSYAKSVRCPPLLLFGALDNRVSLEEANLIHANVRGKKTLKIYANEGHDLFTSTNQMQWQKDVQAFLTTVDHS